MALDWNHTHSNMCHKPYDIISNAEYFIGKAALTSFVVYFTRIYFESVHSAYFKCIHNLHSYIVQSFSDPEAFH